MALTSKLTAIADAIRAKTGGSAKLSLDDMPTAIASIESGGGGGFDPKAMHTVRVDIPGRTTVTIHTSTSSGGNFVTYTTTTARNGETYSPQSTNFMASTLEAKAGDVTCLGICNGLYMYIINNDGNILLQ